jgi:DNA polymerase-1
VRLLTLYTGTGCYAVDLFEVPIEALGPLWAALAQRPIAGHNLAFDLSFLMRSGFEPRACRDTMLASQLLRAGLSADRQGRPVGHKLADLAERYLGLTLDKTHQLADWSGPLTPEMLQYAALDAELPVRLWPLLEQEIRQAELERTLAVELGALPAVAGMTAEGVGFDRAAWLALHAQTALEHQAVRADLDRLAPNDYSLFDGTAATNWDSPAQVRRVLAALGCPVTSTDDDALAGIGHPIGELLRRYRAAAKRLSAYGPGWQEYLDPDGHIRPSWVQLGAASGRMSCRNPNLQQLPRDPAYRRCFVAAPSHVLIKADYSQIELRLAAKIANEERMIAAYRKGDDLHTLTAQTLTGKAEVSKADRQLAKAVNFGLLYGMGARGLAQYARTSYGVNLTEAEAARHRKAFFALYAGLARWHRRTTGNGATETRTLTGRRRLDVTRYTERLNTPVQGSGADGLKVSLGLLWQRRAECPSARLVLAVHDEIVLEVPQAEAEQARDWLIRCMKDGMRPLLDPVPVEVEATIAPTWGG